MFLIRLKLRPQDIWRISLLSLILLLTSGGCSAPTTTPTATDAPIITSSPASTHTPPRPTGTPTQVATLTPSSIPSRTYTPSASPSATVTPTYAILRGKVLERSNCRYGPGAPYLYKYGLLPDTPMDVIGRNDRGTWLLIQAGGGDNPCWIKATLMDVPGDVMSVAPTYIPLPLSPYYGALSGVAAVRQGDEVIVSWHPLSLRAGDEVDQVIEAPYVVEAWVCQDGQIIFTPVGAYINLVTIRDEAGCSEPSHARLFGSEKHGYTPWVEVPWPTATVSTPEG